MRVTEYGADDNGSIEAGRLILNAARAVDVPWIPELTAHRRAMQVRHGYDRSPERHFLAWADGVPVGVAQLELPEWDNQDLAWFYLVIHPAHRGRGHGSEFLAHLTRVSRESRTYQDRWQRVRVDGDGGVRPASRLHPGPGRGEPGSPPRHSVTGRGEGGVRPGRAAG